MSEIAFEVSNKKENKSCIEKKYSPGNQILIILDVDECRNQPKMNAPTKWPFTISHVHSNGTVAMGA
jgi:hypothetical protein